MIAVTIPSVFWGIGEAVKPRRLSGPQWHSAKGPARRSSDGPENLAQKDAPGGQRMMAEMVEQVGPPLCVSKQDGSCGTHHGRFGWAAGSLSETRGPQAGDE